MYDICCIGHITLDKVVTPSSSIHMAGGTSFYFSNAIRNMEVKYCLITAIAQTEMKAVEDLRKNQITVHVLPSKHTVYFENIYTANLDNRVQRVLQTADSFTVDQLEETEASIFHLGPLLANDIPLEVIQSLASRSRVSLDVQGYLREVVHHNVCAIDWADKKEGLKYIDILKASESEMEVLTGVKEIEAGARILNEWGVKEVVITMGSKGSMIYDGITFHHVKAYRPTAEIDATGCGDTYMAGYLYQRVKGSDIQYSGEFASAMASLKIESSGPFTGTEEDILKLMCKTH